MGFNKFHAQRAHCGKHSHASRGEAEFCCELQLQERAGLLVIEKNQPNVFLTEAKIRIIPDWLVRQGGKEFFIDYKGFDSQSWKRNRKLWQHYGPMPLQVWRKKGNRFFCSEIIQGKEATTNGEKEENEKVREEKEVTK